MGRGAIVKKFYTGEEKNNNSKKIIIHQIRLYKELKSGEKPIIEIKGKNLELLEKRKNEIQDRYNLNKNNFIKSVLFVDSFDYDVLAIDLTTGEMIYDS